MNLRKAGLAYAGVTTALLLAILVSGWCWGPARVRGGSHSVCLAIWLLSGLLLALSQIVFCVIAVRRKHYLVLVLAGCFLLTIAGFVFVLSNMPS
jgi:hypothetical protein